MDRFPRASHQSDIVTLLQLCTQNEISLEDLFNHLLDGGTGPLVTSQFVDGISPLLETVMNRERVRAMWEVFGCHAVTSDQWIAVLSAVGQKADSQLGASSFDLTHRLVQPNQGQSSTQLEHNKKAEDFQHYERLASMGNKEAQASLGWCFENGVGVPRSTTSAAEWYERAAAQNHAAAQHNLGWCFANGEGVPRSLEQAIYWYKRAASNGLEVAQSSLGWCYMQLDKEADEDSELQKAEPEIRSTGTLDHGFEVTPTDGTDLRSWQGTETSSAFAEDFNVDTVQLASIRSEMSRLMTTFEDAPSPGPGSPTNQCPSENNEDHRGRLRHFPPPLEPTLENEFEHSGRSSISDSDLVSHADVEPSSHRSIQPSQLEEWDTEQFVVLAALLQLAALFRFNNVTPTAVFQSLTNLNSDQWQEGQTTGFAFQEFQELIEDLVDWDAIVIQRVFDFIDVDGDGLIDSEEWESALERTHSSEVTTLLQDTSIAIEQYPIAEFGGCSRCSTIGPATGEVETPQSWRRRRLEASPAHKHSIISGRDLAPGGILDHDAESMTSCVSVSGPLSPQTAEMESSRMTSPRDTGTVTSPTANSPIAAATSPISTSEAAATDLETFGDAIQSPADKSPETLAPTTVTDPPLSVPVAANVSCSPPDCEDAANKPVAPLTPCSKTSANESEDVRLNDSDNIGESMHDEAQEQDSTGHEQPLKTEGQRVEAFPTEKSVTWSSRGSGLTQIGERGVGVGSARPASVIDVLRQQLEWHQEHCSHTTHRANGPVGPLTGPPRPLTRLEERALALLQSKKINELGLSTAQAFS